MKKKKAAQMPKGNEAASPDSMGARFMSMDTILAQLSSMKDNSISFIDGRDAEANEIWAADVAACEAATAIITALQDEGISNPEQVRDLVHDYKAQVKQYQTMHQKYEVPVRPKNFGGAWLCPDCSRRMRPGNNFCWNCGKRLGW